MGDDLGAGFFSRQFFIECCQCLLGCGDLVVQDHLHHSFGDPEHLVGCQTDIQLVLLNIGLQVVHLRHQLQRHVLLVRHHVLAVGDMILSLLIDHSGHDVQNQLFPFRVIHTLVGGSDLEGGISQIPVILLRLTEIGHQQHLVLASAGEGDDIRAGAAVHGSFTLAEHILRGSVGIGCILCTQTDLLLEIEEVLENRQPHFFRKLIGGTALILLTPLTPLDTLKHGDRNALQDLHTGVVCGKIGYIAPNTHSLEGLAGSDEAFIVRGDGDIVLVKQGLVDDEAVHLCAGGKPVHSAIIIGIAVQIGTVIGARQFGVAQVIQEILQQHRILQGKAAHRQNIGHIIVIRTETVVIRGVGCQNKFKLHLREQVAEVLGIGIQHLIAPAGNDHLFLFFCLGCAVFPGGSAVGALSSTSGEHGCCHN